MPESGLQAAERPTVDRPTAGSQVLGDTGDLSEYRSNWTAGGELPKDYAKLTLFTQPVPNGLEVAVVESAKASRKSELEEIWRKRKGGRASPVLVVAVHAGAVAMSPANAVPPADTTTLPADTASQTSLSAATDQFTLCWLAIVRA